MGHDSSDELLRRVSGPIGQALAVTAARRNHGDASVGLRAGLVNNATSQPIEAVAGRAERRGLSEHSLSPGWNQPRRVPAVVVAELRHRAGGDLPKLKNAVPERTDRNVRDNVVRV